MRPYNGFPGDLRERAQRWINAEIRAGRLLPPRACTACGQTVGGIDFHSENYAEPFGAHVCQFPLCVICHLALHLRFQHPQGWDGYRAAVRRGWRFAALASRDIGTVVGILSDMGRAIPVRRRTEEEPSLALPTPRRPYLRGAPPTLLVLDSIHEGGAPSPERPRVRPVFPIYAERP